MLQALVRWKHGRGYDIIAASPGYEKLLDIFLLLPEISNSEQRFFSKSYLEEGSILFKFSSPDGHDNYGRPLLRSHSIVFTPEEYRNLGLPRILAPFLSGKKTEHCFQEECLLSLKDFPKKTKIEAPSSKILEKMLTHLQVEVTSPIYNEEIMKEFSVLDYALPDEAKISILSYVPASLRNKHTDWNLIFLEDPEAPIKPDTRDSRIKWIQQLAESVKNPENLHEKQREILSSVNDDVIKLYKARFMGIGKMAFKLKIQHSITGTV